MARIIAIFVALLIAAFELHPDARSAISVQSDEALLAGTTIRTVAPGGADARTGRRCLGSLTAATPNACQIDKRASEAPLLPSPSLAPSSHAADLDALPRGRDPAPDHGPPRQPA